MATDIFGRIIPDTNNDDTDIFGRRKADPNALLAQIKQPIDNTEAKRKLWEEDAAFQKKLKESDRGILGVVADTGKALLGGAISEYGRLGSGIVSGINKLTSNPSDVFFDIKAEKILKDPNSSQEEIQQANEYLRRKSDSLLGDIAKNTEQTSRYGREMVESTELTPTSKAIASTVGGVVSTLPLAIKGTGLLRSAYKGAGLGNAAAQAAASGTYGALNAMPSGSAKEVGLGAATGLLSGFLNVKTDAIDSTLKRLGVEGGLDYVTGLLEQGVRNGKFTKEDLYDPNVLSNVLSPILTYKGQKYIGNKNIETEVKSNLEKNLKPLPIDESAQQTKSEFKQTQGESISREKELLEQDFKEKIVSNPYTDPYDGTTITNIKNDINMQHKSAPIYGLDGKSIVGESISIAVRGSNKNKSGVTNHYYDPILKKAIYGHDNIGPGEYLTDPQMLNPRVLKYDMEWAARNPDVIVQRKLSEDPSLPHQYRLSTKGSGTIINADDLKLWDTVTPSDVLRSLGYRLDEKTGKSTLDRTIVPTDIYSINFDKRNPDAAINKSKPISRENAANPEFKPRPLPVQEEKAQPVNNDLLNINTPLRQKYLGETKESQGQQITQKKYGQFEDKTKEYQAVQSQKLIGDLSKAYSDLPPEELMFRLNEVKDSDIDDFDKAGRENAIKNVLMEKHMDYLKEVDPATGVLRYDMVGSDVLGVGTRAAQVLNLIGQFDPRTVRGKVNLIEEKYRQVFSGVTKEKIKQSQGEEFKRINKVAKDAASVVQKSMTDLGINPKEKMGMVEKIQKAASRAVYGDTTMEQSLVESKIIDSSRAKALADQIIKNTNSLSGESLNESGNIIPVKAQRTAIPPDVQRKILEHAERLNGIKDEKEKAILTSKLMGDLLRDAPVSADKKVSAVAALSQLLNPSTVGKNLLSNLALTVTKQGLSDPIAALLSKGLKYKTGIQTSGISTKGALRGFQKFGETIREDAAQRWKGNDISSYILEKSIDPSIVKELGLDHGNKFGVPSAVNLIGKENVANKAALKAQNILSIALKSTDMGAFMQNYTSSVYNQMNGRVPGWDKNHTSTLDADVDVQRQAAKEALQATLQESNWASETSQKIRETLNLNGRISYGPADVLGLRYARVPANAFVEAMRHTPLGYGETIKEGVKFFKNPTPERQRAFESSFGKSTSGLALVALGYGVNSVAKGFMTALADDKEKIENKQDFSITLGQDNYGIEGWGPTVAAMFMGAALAKEVKSVSSEELQKMSIPERMMQKAGTAFSTGLQWLKAQPTVEPISDLFTGQTINTIPNNLIPNTAMQFVPTMVKKLFRESDYKRDISPRAEGGPPTNVQDIKFAKDAKEMYWAEEQWKKTINSVKQYIPGLREDLPIAYNSLGQPIVFDEDTLNKHGLGGTRLSSIEFVLAPWTSRKINQSNAAQVGKYFYDTLGKVMSSPESIKNKVVEFSVKDGKETLNFQLNKREAEQYLQHATKEMSALMDFLAPRLANIKDKNAADLIYEEFNKEVGKLGNRAKKYMVEQFTSQGRLPNSIGKKE